MHKDLSDGVQFQAAQRRLLSNFETSETLNKSQKTDRSVSKMLSAPEALGRKGTIALTDYEDLVGFLKRGDNLVLVTISFCKLGVQSTTWSMQQNYCNTLGICCCCWIHLRSFSIKDCTGWPCFFQKNELEMVSKLFLVQRT